MNQVIVKSGFLVTALALLGQAGQRHIEHHEITNMVQKSNVPATREAALEELMALSEDTTAPYEARLLAIHGLGKVEPPEAKAQLRALAQQPEKNQLSDHEFHMAQQLAHAAAKVYWQIVVAEIESSEAQKSELLKLVRGENPEPKSPFAAEWAVQELASRGEEEVLPDLLEHIRNTQGSDRYSQELQWLATKKVTLLNQHETRFEALKAALEGEDETQGSFLKRWAIDELAKLGTPEAVDYLVAIAKRMQEENYDERGELRDHLDVDLQEKTMIYRNSVTALRELGWSTEQLNAAGLFPNKYFWFPGEGGA